MAWESDLQRHIRPEEMKDLKELRRRSAAISQQRRLIYRRVKARALRAADAQPATQP